MKLCFIVLALGTLAKSDTILGELSRTGMREKSVEVDQGRFTINHVERLCRAELRRKPRVKVTILRIFGKTGGAPLPQPLHGRTYEYWRNIYDQTPRSNEIAEMIAIGSNSVLRMRHATGQVERRVLTGTDPLQIGMHGSHFEILYLTFTTARAYVLQAVSVYVTTTATLGTPVGLELLKILTPLFPDLEVSVNIRNDSWFINEPGYPFLNPFIEEKNPPSSRERKTPTLSCGYWTGSPSCILQ
jgi:hypothetical protein